MLKGGKTADKSLFRRGSKRLSNEGVDDALNAKHLDEIKKAEHLKKKLKAHHDEARVVLAKKLQVENARLAPSRSHSSTSRFSLAGVGGVVVFHGGLLCFPVIDRATVCLSLCASVRNA